MIIFNVKLTSNFDLNKIVFWIQTIGWYTLVLNLIGIKKLFSSYD